MDCTAPFESALSSIVPLPAQVSNSTNYSSDISYFTTPLNSPPKLNFSVADHEISGNLPVATNFMALPNPNFAPFPAEPGLADRAAKFSCFGNYNFGGKTNHPEDELAYKPWLRVENRKLLRVSSNQSLNAGSQMAGWENLGSAMTDCLEGEMRSASASGSALDKKISGLSRSSTPDNVEFSNAHREMSATEPSSNATSEVNARKRKVSPRGKAKDAKATEEDDPDTKRCKPAEAADTGKDTSKANAGDNGSSNTGSDGKNQSEYNCKPPEPPKQDYIHVRARRGQATDSHSLAERVRREKISERMKLLQDLVPGCNKVTGKAVMLDEIINYVQSLQRQVEFLSMKLATMNPRLDFNMESLLSKDIFQSRRSLQQSVCPIDSPASVFPLTHQPHQGPLQTVVSDGLEIFNPIDATLCRALGTQLPAIDIHGDASSQLATFWEDDLQSVVHTRFVQNQEMPFTSQSFQGLLPTANTKIEL